MGTHRIENWPRAAATMAPDLEKEFAAHAGDGRVGNQRLSDTDRVRVWAIGLKRGQRPGFHTHVLDYFWTSVTGCHGRSHFSDGRVSDTAYKAGDIKPLGFVTPTVADVSFVGKMANGDLVRSPPIPA